MVDVTNDTTQTNGINWQRIFIGGFIVAVIAGGGFAAFLLTSDDTVSIAAGEAAATLEADTSTGTVITYSIASAGSEARFELDEDLRGERVTVVGTTNDVGGQIRINFDTPAASEVGEIVVNARTLQTDNTFRDGAIDRLILETGNYEFIRFQPTRLSNLPETPVSAGETVEFQITGDLTIRDITSEVTFDAQATPGDDGIVTGSARTTITRDAYNLTIPSVPNVANVEEEIELIIEFTAIEDTPTAEETPAADA